MIFVLQIIFKIKAIGTREFDKQLIAGPTEVTCKSNCTLIKVNCTTTVQKFAGFMGVECPMTYFKCSKNVIMLNKLVSGYYTNQELPDGTPWPKPGTVMKCSHGGFLDKDSFTIQAVGGINKDVGYYLFSPHADLHLKASRLAISHTEEFFNQIRAKIGDTKFDHFLRITSNYF